MHLLSDSCAENKNTTRVKRANDRRMLSGSTTLRIYKHSCTCLRRIYTRTAIEFDVVISTPYIYIDGEVSWGV